MRSRTWRLLVTVIVAIGLLATVTSLAATGADKARPFRMNEVAEFELDGDCDSGAPRTVIVGSGVATHLGRFEVSGQTCADSDVGSVTWTAANGDEINILFTDAITGPVDEDDPEPNEFYIELYAQEVSGTGRFERVELGSEPASGTITFYDELGTSGRIEASMDDVIYFDPSDRRN